MSTTPIDEYASWGPQRDPTKQERGYFLQTGSNARPTAHLSFCAVSGTEQGEMGWDARQGSRRDECDVHHVDIDEGTLTD